MQSNQQVNRNSQHLTSFQAGDFERAMINASGISMTTDKEDSIPHGSKLVIKRIPNDPFLIPLRKPVVISGEHSGQSFLVCKLVTFIDLVQDRIKCESLNTKYKPFWIPLSCIQSIFEVEEVIN